MLCVMPEIRGSISVLHVKDAFHGTLAQCAWLEIPAGFLDWWDGWPEYFASGQEKLFMEWYWTQWAVPLCSWLADRGLALRRSI